METTEAGCWTKHRASVSSLVFALWALCFLVANGAAAQDSQEFRQRGVY